MDDTLRSSDDHLVFPTPDEMITAHLKWMEAGGFSDRSIGDAGRFLRWADKRLPAGILSNSEEWTELFAGQGWSAQSKATYRGHARRFFQWATDPDDPWIDSDPTTRLRRPKVRRGIPRPATDDQVRAAITRTGQPFRLHCRLAAYAGLRCIEVARLQRDDLDEREIRVYGKGDKPAVLPMHPLIWEMVADMPPGPVSVRPTAEPNSAHWVSCATSFHLQQRHGVATTMHRLRAWYITMIQRTYKDATVTQRLARHESLETTQGYVLVADQAVRDAVAGLPDLTAP